MPALHHHSGVAASSFGLLTSYLRSTRPLASAACAGLSTCDSSREPDFAHWLIVACAGFVTGSVVSACTADLPLTSACAKPAQTLQRFEEWAEAIGSDLALVTVTNWQQAQKSLGLGLFSKTDAHQTQGHGWRVWSPVWWRGHFEVELASFLLRSAISAKSITSHSDLAPTYASLLEAGQVDERTLVMLYLLIEQLRGSDSQLGPWLKMLPSHCETPLVYGQGQLQELKGTTLHRATQVLRGQLQQKWQKLQPAVQRLLAEAGVRARAPTFDDFLWAYSMFWSRAQTIPVSEEREEEVLECIVPGLDFCNHAPHATCRWAVQGNKVSLLTPWKALPKEGQQVFIDYGEKSNEQLLLLYGFAEIGNKHELLMVQCPLPELRDRGPDWQLRLYLLQQAGLTPQLFLTQDFIEGFKHKPRECPVPAEAWQTLQLLVSEPQRLQALANSSGAAFSSPEEEEGTHLAGLTALVRLLELKLYELEGEQGTGPLEDDIRLLEAHENGTTLSNSLQACIIYRAGQKRLARLYLDAARSALTQEMQLLQGAMR